MVEVVRLRLAVWEMISVRACIGPEIPLPTNTPTTAHTRHAITTAPNIV